MGYIRQDITPRNRLPDRRAALPLATAVSTGTAADGGWQRWWEIESRRNGADWKSLIDAADLALSRLRAAHSTGASS
jgi:hypothetical protein